MPINDDSHSLRLCESLNKHIGQSDADECASKLPLSKSADFMYKFKWAEQVCVFLNGKYSEDNVKKIRMDCCCLPPKNRMDKVKRLYVESADLDEFTVKYNAEYAGRSSVWHKNGDLYFSYPTCYCSCVKRMNKPLSKTWCLCTLGYTKRLFDYVFDCDTKAELMESIKLGDARCVIKITRP